MKFIDLSAQQKRIREKIETRLRAVLDHGQYILGPEIGMLESELAAYTGTRYAVACSSGTDALLIALMAYGVGPGDAVVTSTFTFFATAEVISLLGAVPVFIDIDPETFNIDPSALDATLLSLSAKHSPHPLPYPASRRDPKVKGVIGVDLFGLPADYTRIRQIAARHGLFVIEDAAQSFGSEYFGKKACSLGDLGCTSFFPAKPLGAYGDGGMCFTDDESVAALMRSISLHGQGSNKYDNVRIGINGRLDTMQAAILLAKMEIFPEELGLRRERAEKYASFLGDDISPVICPRIPNGYSSAWAQYSVLTKEGVDRSRLLAKLHEAGVPTAIYYPIPLHLQRAFADLGHREGDLPVSERIADRIFSLPMHPYLGDDEQERIARILKDSCR